MTPESGALRGIFFGSTVRSRPSFSPAFLRMVMVREAGADGAVAVAGEERRVCV